MAHRHFDGGAKRSEFRDGMGWGFRNESAFPEFQPEREMGHTSTVQRRGQLCEVAS